MKTRGRWRLSVMMALLYAVQGVFWPLLGVHLGELGIDGRWRGLIFASQALAATLLPLGAGQLVDRLMPTQTFLVLAYGMGTLLLAALASGWIVGAVPLFLTFLLYFSIIMPTHSLSSSLAMRNLDDPRREFASVRLWGTVGWMAVGWLASIVMLTLGGGRLATAGGIPEVFWTAAALSLVMAVYCATLPNTPPLAGETSGRANLRKGVEVLREKDVRVFLITAFGVFLTIPLVYQVVPAYLAARGLPRPWISTAMSLGQAPEVVALAVMPWLLGRWGYKGTMTLGLAAWVLRYLVLATHPPLWLAVGVGVLQGVGIACFSIGGQVFLDGRAPTTHRASVQAIFLILSTGLPSFLGSLAVGEWVRRISLGDDVWVFLVPCILDGALLVYFVRGFRSQTPIAGRSGAAVDDDADRLQRLPARRGVVACVGNLVTESADG
ncbi:MFS transporter [Planctomyces sp. SH-PL62]|uniref:MFS transporter n=1 Tax=Planctomyces sp. SH-PL62 TaxID=1636152 RepID=UPI00078D115B|nr:MFS transporter [Planctomyces sp. SH-PL62]AMV37430.1 Putative nucleoside transporter YegT [Planctomyces sp. SH-PL62]